MAGTKVVVAMSGGVDSSVCAALLVSQGYEVSGIMLRLWSEDGFNLDGRRDNRCCTRDQMMDAHFVARKLGIPFRVLDARDEFKTAIVNTFVDGYVGGTTPNPCLACNRQIRFGFLLEAALDQGAEYLATGHYARVVAQPDGNHELRKGADPRKDQSYVLSFLTQRQLRHAMFPLGSFNKPEVRAMAKKFDLPVAEKRESQDLCFIADGNYRRFVADHAPTATHPGTILLVDGTPVGEHTGLLNYTVGQRKGLGISWEEPLYVVAKNTANNTLTVGTRDTLGCQEFAIREVNWILPPRANEPFGGDVKIRYKADPVAATIYPHDGTVARVQLDVPLPDVTPGQAAVIYEKDRVIGGGIIQSG